MTHDTHFVLVNRYVVDGNHCLHDRFLIWRLVFSSAYHLWPMKILNFHSNGSIVKAFGRFRSFNFKIPLQSFLECTFYVCIIVKVDCTFSIFSSSVWTYMHYRKNVFVVNLKKKYWKFLNLILYWMHCTSHQQINWSTIIYQWMFFVF